MDRAVSGDLLGPSVTTMLKWRMQARKRCGGNLSKKRSSGFHVGNRASANPVRGETGLGDYTAETLRSRRSSYRDIILNKPSANSVPLW